MVGKEKERDVTSQGGSSMLEQGSAKRKIEGYGVQLRFRRSGRGHPGVT